MLNKISCAGISITVHHNAHILENIGVRRLSILRVLRRSLWLRACIVTSSTSSRALACRRKSKPSMDNQLSSVIDNRFRVDLTKAL